MKATKLIEILQQLDLDTEVFVGAWSPEEDYDRTADIKVCLLPGKNVIVCDKKSEYWKVENLSFIRR